MVKAVGIVGGGIMGSGIAEVAARSGLDVVLREVNEAAVEGAQARLTASLDKAVRNGKLALGERNAIIDRVRFTDTLDDLSECDLVAEAAVEDEDAKTAIFAALGKVVRPGCAAHQQHLLHTDHETRRGDAGPGTRRGHALLQPGDGAATGRSHSM
jgi:3-hydroxybutyryl-CoA dehydrogenase